MLHVGGAVTELDDGFMSAEGTGSINKLVNKSAVGRLHSRHEYWRMLAIKIPSPLCSMIHWYIKQLNTFVHILDTK